MSVLQLDPMYELLDVVLKAIADRVGFSTELWASPTWRNTGRGAEISWAGPNGQRVVLYDDGRFAFRGLSQQSGSVLGPGDRRWLGRAVLAGMWSESAREAIEYFRRMRRERQL